MGNIYLVPAWFYGYDVILEIIFAVITLLVSWYAFKVYKLSCQNQTKILGAGFLLISLSYIMQSLVNIAIISKVNENICAAIKIIDINRLNIIGVHFYTILFLAGLVTLVYMTFKTENIMLYSLLIFMSIASLMLGFNILYVFYLLSTILLIYINIHYVKNYLNKKQIRSFLILLSFIFLLIGKIHFIFSVNHSLYYVIGHFLELVAYTIILAGLLSVIKK